MVSGGVAVTVGGVEQGVVVFVTVFVGSVTVNIGVVVLLTQMVVAVDVNPVKVIRFPEQSVYEIAVVTKPTLIFHSVHGADSVVVIVGAVNVSASCSIISLGNASVNVFTSSGVFKSWTSYISFGVNIGNFLTKSYKSYLVHPAKNESITWFIVSLDDSFSNSLFTNTFIIDGWSTITLKLKLPFLDVFVYVYIGSGLPKNVLSCHPVFTLSSKVKS